MSPATFRLVLLVSLAHAMVHTFEHSLPAVEQMIGDDFEVGIGPIATTFKVSKTPYKEGETWKMVVDGVELTRIR